MMCNEIHHTGQGLEKRTTRRMGHSEHESGDEGDESRTEEDHHRKEPGVNEGG